MVSYSDVLRSNEALKSTSSGLTAVFVGATAGIGLGALRAFTQHSESPTVYIVGRSATTLSIIIDKLKALNTTATFIPISAADLTLVQNADKACQQILTHASSARPAKIDMLCITAGYVSLSSRDPSAEGLDKLTAIRYYARMRFVTLLLPLLRAAPAPRVVSVLAGGQEGRLWADDFLLEAHYSVVNAAGAGASMTSFFMEELARAEGNEKIAFVHLFPGLVVDTALTQTEHFGAVMKALLGWVVLPLLRPFGYTAKEAGERVLFAATSRSFARLDGGEGGKSGSVSKISEGVVGSGVFLVQADSSTAEETTVYKEMREQGMGPLLYEHTMEQYARIVGEQ